MGRPEPLLAVAPDPGRLDVQGGALLGTPDVQIGFNADVARSHTVSTAQRFSLRLLQLVPGAPTHYVVAGQVREMVPMMVDVPGGPSATVWQTVFGPVVVVPSLGLGWIDANAVAIDDANGANIRMLDQWNAMNRAASVGDLVDAMVTWSTPWRTTSASRGSTPPVRTARRRRVRPTVDHHWGAGRPGPAVHPGVPAADVAAVEVAVLAGTTHACDPVADPTHRPTACWVRSSLPVLVTHDWVTQSNDSHWLSNPTNHWRIGPRHR